jgi:hypothetical protein
MPINFSVLKKTKASLAAALLFALFAFVPGGLASAATAPDGARVTSAESCKSYSGQAKEACSTGFDATLGDKAAARANKSEVPTKDYNSEATADAVAICAATKYKSAANLAACQHGYKDGHYAYYHVTDHNPITATPTQNTNLCPPGSKVCADPAADPSSKCDNQDCDFVRKFINPAINTLTACFGIIAVISLIIGGINYSTSEGDPQKTSRAKNRIINTIIAVVAYIFLYAFLNFLIPGGAFK